MKKIKGFLPSATLIIWDIISVAVSVTPGNISDLLEFL